MKLVLSILVFLHHWGFLAARGGGGGGGGGGVGAGSGSGGNGDSSSLALMIIFPIMVVGIILRYYVWKYNANFEASECDKKRRLRETKPATLAAVDASYATSWACDSCSQLFLNANDDLLLRCHSCKLDYCEKCSRGRRLPSVTLDQTIRPNLSPQGTCLRTPSTLAMMGGGYAKIAASVDQNKLCDQQMKALKDVLANRDLQIVPRVEGQNVERDDPSAHIEQSQLCPNNMEHIHGVLAENGLRIAPASTNSSIPRVVRVL